MTAKAIQDAYTELPSAMARHNARKKEKGLCARGGCKALCAEKPKGGLYKECQTHVEDSRVKQLKLYYAKKEKANEN